MADHPYFATPPRQTNSDIEASRESSSWVEWGDQFLRHLFSSPLEQYQNGVPSSSAPPPPPPPPPPPSTPPPPPSFSSSSSSSRVTVHHATVHHSANMETSPTSHSGHRVADRQAELSAEYQQIEERRKSLAGQLLFIVWEMNNHTKRLKEIESELSAERKRKQYLNEEAHLIESKKAKVGSTPPPPPPLPPTPVWHGYGSAARAPASQRPKPPTGEGVLKIFHTPQLD